MKGANLILSVLLLCAVVAGAKWISGAMVDGLTKPGEVPGAIGVYKEPAGSRPMRIEAVSRLPENAFSLREDCCEFGRPKGPVWLRFKVSNDSSLAGYRREKTRFITEVVNPFIPDLHYYRLNSALQPVDSFATGALGYRFQERPDQYSRNFRFPMYLPADSTAWIYLRLGSDVPLQLRVLFFEEGERTGHQQWLVDILMTIFLVFCMLFLVLSAILIAVSREYFNWYYFFYILVTTLFIQAQLGLGFRYAWPDWPILQHIVPMALNTLRMLLGIQFFRLYFDLPRRTPIFDRFVRGSLKAFTGILILQVVAPLFGRFQWVFYPFFVFLMLFCSAMLVWLSYEVLFKKRARFSMIFFVVGLNFIGATAISLQYLGYSPDFLDFTDDALTAFGIANTFFLPTFVIVAFFLEMVLVFYFSVRRFLSLIEKNRRAELALAKARETGLNALVQGAEDERKRIARELHDGACVNLAAINMKMDLLREQLGNTPQLAEHARVIADDLDATYREVRDISHDLMSKALEKTGLLAALQELVARAQQARPDLRISLYANFPFEELSEISNIHLYRMVQELVGNILKHAQARNASVQLLDIDGDLLLTVEDDGKGFDPAGATQDGIGHANVRTRAAVLRGKMHIDARPGNGTFIAIEIPRQGLAEKG